MNVIKEEMLCAGFGGQGIMILGKIIAHIAMNMGYNVTWMPSYGAEVRGGTAHSMVRIQTEKIANPVVVNPTTCVVLNEESLLKFAEKVKPGGLLLVDNTGVKNIPKLKNVEVKEIPFTKIAVELGDKRAANMVVLGFLSGIKDYLPIQKLIDCLSLVFKERPELIPLNEKALKSGRALSGEMK